jgi:metallo-beta-lactamase family protein
MELQFMGAARTVTGSMHLLHVNGSRVLLECGLFQGHRAESMERNRSLGVDATTVDAMVLSHAHIDHSGNIPSLVKNGFTGNIYCTPATRDLCSIMLRDAGHIQEEDAAYLNKKLRRQGKPPIEPIYTQEDAARSMAHFISINYERPFPLAPGVTLRFFDAGHILGSALVCLDIDEGEGAWRLLFTGDLGRPNYPLLNDPAAPDGVRVLITESTYGDRLHGSSGENIEALAQVVNRAYGRGGKVIIPAFSVGRTQNIVYGLHQLIEEGRIPELPVYVDSPLSVNATEVFLLHPECYDDETRQFLLQTHSRNPFSFSTIHYVREVAQSKQINDLTGPAVIISASGMAETGRILHHLKNNIEDPRNIIAIVGWQAPYTLGRRLVERQPRVRIFGQEYVRRAEVCVLNGLSAHADRDELLGWFAQVQGPELEHVFVVHGEGDASISLAEAISKRGVPHVTVPERGDVVSL